MYTHTHTHTHTNLGTSKRAGKGLAVVASGVDETFSAPFPRASFRHHLCADVSFFQQKKNFQEKKIRSTRFVYTKLCAQLFLVFSLQKTDDATKAFSYGFRGWGLGVGLRVPHAFLHMYVTDTHTHTHIHKNVYGAERAYSYWFPHTCAHTHTLSLSKSIIPKTHVCHAQKKNSFGAERAYSYW